METVWKLAKDNLVKAAEQMKKHFNKGRKKLLISVGSKVLLEGSNICTNQPSAKLGDCQYGPFKVVEKVGKGAWKLELPPGWSIHPVFHKLLLTPYRGAERNARPLPDLVKGQEEFEVEKVLDLQKQRGKKQWLVKWKGYPLEEAT